jgi:hypothetical protein
MYACFFLSVLEISERLAWKSGFFTVNTVDYLWCIIMYGLNGRYRNN